MKEEVLNLMTNLLKCPSVVEQLVGIGAVEFFTQLRPNVDCSLQAVIDGILDGLFVLPSDVMLDYHTNLSEAGPEANPVILKEPHAGYFHQGKNHSQESEMPPKQPTGRIKDYKISLTAEITPNLLACQVSSSWGFTQEWQRINN
ncbi:PREDICTED: rotatin-like [Thamnophis sirtalis]|uniref:Rotatin-like n=1 Tax=Thamnophis sirtalis TaxID=35019 RepID=A0A6I9Z850_9SAUR|nr:PREDICTED: rotatin-like [Thamnophis sirtalis]